MRALEAILRDVILTYEMGEFKALGERVQKTVSQFLYQAEHTNLVFSCSDINFIITTSCFL